MYILGIRETSGNQKHVAEQQGGQTMTTRAGKCKGLTRCVQQETPRSSQAQHTVSQILTRTVPRSIRSMVEETTHKMPPSITKMVCVQHVLHVALKHNCLLVVEDGS
jgi:hypothetical protein